MIMGLRFFFLLIRLAFSFFRKIKNSHQIGGLKNQSIAEKFRGLFPFEIGRGKAIEGSTKEFIAKGG